MRICNHCESALMRLKWEVAQCAGKAPKNSYSFVEPMELLALVVQRILEAS